MNVTRSIWKHSKRHFCRSFWNGSYLMVIIDDKSRYPVVKFCQKSQQKWCYLNSTACVRYLESRTSLKLTMIHRSRIRFQRICESFGFKHRKITFVWPQANREAESFMKTARKSIREAHSEFVVRKKIKRNRVPEIILPAMKKKIIQDNDHHQKRQLKQYADE